MGGADKVGRDHRESLGRRGHKNKHICTREKKNQKVISGILFFFGHRSLTKNNTQTAVMNITDKRIVRKK